MNRRYTVVVATVATLTCGCATTSRIDVSTSLSSVPPILSAVQQPHPVGTIDLTTVDTANPDDVARAVVTTLNQYDTRTDTSPTDAAGRAAPLLTPDLATDLATASIRTDSTWLDLDRHDGYTLATTDLANEYGQPVNTSTAALVQVSVVVHLIGRDGWSVTEQARVVRIRLDRISVGQSWLISGFPS